MAICKMISRIVILYRIKFLNIKKKIQNFNRAKPEVIWYELDSKICPTNVPLLSQKNLTTAHILKGSHKSLQNQKRKAKKTTNLN
jgi:hypothetical protein